MTTPEAAAYQAQKDATERAQARFYKRLAVVLAVAVLVNIGGRIYDSYETHEIRVTQLCQDRAFNAVLNDARHAIGGDRNAGDYVRAPKSC